MTSKLRTHAHFPKTCLSYQLFHFLVCLFIEFLLEQLDFFVYFLFWKLELSRVFDWLSSLFHEPLTFYLDFSTILFVILFLSLYTFHKFLVLRTLGRQISWLAIVILRVFLNFAYKFQQLLALWLIFFLPPIFRMVQSGFSLRLNKFPYIIFSLSNLSDHLFRLWFILFHLPVILVCAIFQ